MVYVSKNALNEKTNEDVKLHRKTILYLISETKKQTFFSHSPFARYKHQLLKRTIQITLKYSYLLVLMVTFKVHDNFYKLNCY